MILAQDVTQEAQALDQPTGIAPTHTQLFINSVWTDGCADEAIPVRNPATGEAIGTVSRAERPDLDGALDAAERGFCAWRKISTFERAKIMRRAADIVRSRVDAIARILTLQQGKPLSEARTEVLNGADIIDWFADEGRRTYGRVIPPRAQGVYQLVLKEPVGPVVAFSPWNFPINQAVRKISIALAAGCSIILKGPEETPAPCAELVRAFDDAGVAPGAVNLVFGAPADISEYLIAHPTIRKISFTGSTAVGKHLAALAGSHMKRMTMELGGHAPVIIFDDADLDAAAKLLVISKYRNAGQVCTSPTRFLIQRNVYDSFVERFVTACSRIRVGDGLHPETTMGPLAHPKRLQATDEFVTDAVARGAEILAGGCRIGNKGYYFAPTVLAHASQKSRVMNYEPFGPVAVMMQFSDFDEAVYEANRLPYGLAAYAWTKSAKTANLIGGVIESGMVCINHVTLALPEVPFGGVKDSGYGSEGGSEAMDAYQNSKFVTQAGL